MLFNYELTLVTAGGMSEAESNKVIEKVKKLLPKDVKIVREDDWGVKDLAYHIHKNDKGRFVQLGFVSESAPIGDLNKALNIEEGLLRYLLLKHDAVKENKIEVKAGKKK